MSESASIRRIVLADDHPVVLAGLRSLVETSDDLQVVGQATNGQDALQLILELLPDVAVVDLSMPLMNGIELVQAVAERCPSVAVLVLTAHEEPAYVQRVLRSGASGYLLKRSLADDLLRAIRAVLSNGLFIDPAVGGALLPSRSRLSSHSEDLSDREKAVLQLVAQGNSGKQIAFALQISIKTVETYKARALSKLGLQNRADIVLYARGQGWS